jgi:arylsulfate sulfotransferase
MNKVTHSNGSIIVSCRNQNAVVKLSYPEGKIQWILGTHDQYSPYWRQFLLSPVGDNFEWQYQQHYCTVLPDDDNNADTMDVMVFDNGRTRFDADAEIQRQIRAN